MSTNTYTDFWIDGDNLWAQDGAGNSHLATKDETVEVFKRFIATAESHDTEVARLNTEITVLRDDAAMDAVAIAQGLLDRVKVEQLTAELAECRRLRNLSDASDARAFNETQEITARFAEKVERLESEHIAARVEREALQGALKTALKDSVPRSRYEAANQDWLDEKEKGAKDRTAAIAEVERLEGENERLATFIRDRGYVRCDVPACNCNSFHRGHAETRLAEIHHEIGETLPLNINPCGPIDALRWFAEQLRKAEDERERQTAFTRANYNTWKALQERNAALRSAVAPFVEVAQQVIGEFTVDVDIVTWGRADMKADDWRALAAAYDDTGEVKENNG